MAARSSITARSPASAQGPARRSRCCLRKTRRATGSRSCSAFACASRSIRRSWGRIRCRSVCRCRRAWTRTNEAASGCRNSRKARRLTRPTCSAPSGRSRTSASARSSPPTRRARQRRRIARRPPKTRRGSRGSNLPALRTRFDMTLPSSALPVAPPPLAFLILFRVIQGAVAGPMIPLSQSLLLSSYPKAKAGTALAMWAITTLVAPVVGPLLGGWITDNIAWPWIFYINVPVGLAAVAVTWMIYRDRETTTVKLPIDGVGLGLLVIWVGALQIMLDKGKDLDWFASGQITALGIAASVGFALFIVWELTERHPVVDLKLFARRNFWTSTLAMSLAYGAFFGNVVLLPLWLQQYMGYTATAAGMVLAPVGILAILLTPIVGKNMHRVDLRALVTGAFVIFALVLWMRSRFNTSVDFWTLLIPTFIQGAAMAVFFIPLVTLSLSGLTPDRIASASGLFNFARITA